MHTIQRSVQRSVQRVRANDGDLHRFDVTERARTQGSTTHDAVRGRSARPGGRWFTTANAGELSTNQMHGFQSHSCQRSRVYVASDAERRSGRRFARSERGGRSAGGGESDPDAVSRPLPSAFDRRRASARNHWRTGARCVSRPVSLEQPSADPDGMAARSRSHSRSRSPNNEHPGRVSARRTRWTFLGAGRHLRGEQLDDEGDRPQHDPQIRDVEIG